MKNLMNFKDAKILSKVEQRSINGGSNIDCETAGGTWVCIGTEGGWPGLCGCVFDSPNNPPIK